MKHKNQKEYAGVWLDNTKAIIIADASESETAGYAITDTLKAPEMHGGGSEHGMNNAKQSDLLKYYKSLAHLLLNYDEILIFGPGKSQEQFQHHLKDDAQFTNKQITIDSAEHLTDPQMIAKVREFFKTHQS